MCKISKKNNLVAEFELDSFILKSSFCEFRVLSDGNITTLNLHTPNEMTRLLP